MNIIYPFKGKMVELRPFVPEDRVSLFQYLNDPELFEYFIEFDRHIC